MADNSTSVVLSHLTLSNILFGFLTYVVVNFIVSAIQAPRYPTSIHWAGHGKGWLASFQNIFSAFSNSGDWVRNGYNEYNKKNKSYVLPSSFGVPKEVVIPRSQMQWLLDLPDNVLSTSMAHYDILHGDYSFLDPLLLRDPFHEHVIHKSLTRNLNALIPDLSDEVVFDMDESFGLDTENWKSVNLYDLFLRVIPKLTNRMLVGKPLCRNQDYLDNCVAFTNDAVRNLIIFAMTPQAIRGIIGPFAALPGKYHFRKTAKHTLPLIRERIENIRRKDAGENKDWVEPNDYVTWHIRTAMAEGRPDELDPVRIAKRMLSLNFASIHTTSMTGHSVILDLLTADPELRVLESLQEEAERIFREEGNQWTKQGLARMYRTDSAIRESMRYSPFAFTIAQRKVVAPEGITNEAEGWHAPCGTLISCPMIGAHSDPQLHKSPDKYDPFRYSREREKYEARSAENRDAQEGLKLRATGMVTTSDKHFPFGHGRHACPGRFFVAHELKMAIAYLVMNYDIKRLEQRPQAKWVARSMIPPVEARIEVKRRVGTVGRGE